MKVETFLAICFLIRLILNFILHQTIAENYEPVCKSFYESKKVNENP